VLMEVSAEATVRSWDDEQGWGVLESDTTPGGCWTHWSVLDFDGYRARSCGQKVRLKAESPGQDGFPWRAIRVRLDGRAPAAPTETDVGGAYTSSLTVTWDDE